MMETFDWLKMCIPCGSWCCRGENPYASDQEKQALNVKEIGSNEDSSCRFLEKGACSIYQNRPFECRIFPFDVKDIGSTLTWVRWEVCPASSWMEAELFLVEFEQSLPGMYPLDYVKKYVQYYKANEPEKYAQERFAALRPIKWPNP